MAAPGGGATPGLFAGLALILSKLVIVVALAVGFAVLVQGQGLAGLVGGAFLVLIAALMPFATARVLPLAAEELSALHQGRIRHWGLVAVGTAQQVVAAAVGMAGGAPATGAVTLGVAPSMGSTSGPWGGGPRGGDTGGSGGVGGGWWGGPGRLPEVAAGGQPTGGQPPSDDVPPSGGSPAPAPRPGTRDIEVEPPAPPAGPALWGPPTDVIPPEVS